MFDFKNKTLTCFDCKKEVVRVGTVQIRCKDCALLRKKKYFKNWKNNNPKSEPKTVVYCQNCKEEFKVFPYRIRSGVKFCSMDCRNKSYIGKNVKKIKKLCKYCEKIFWIIPSSPQIFCSKKCMNKGQNRSKTSGEGHWNWKGGLSKCIKCGKTLSNRKCKYCIFCLGKSEVTLKRLAKYSNAKKGKKLSKEEIKKCLRRRTPSGLEKRVIKVINKYNLPYKFVGDGKFFIERKNPDFININGEKKAIEVFWKRHKDQFSGGLEKWKQERENIFAKYGWKIVFIEGTGLNEEKILNSLTKGVHLY